MRRTVRYLPGRGATVLNGVPTGTTERAGFAAALFSIRLGPPPLDAHLRSAPLAVH